MSKKKSSFLNMVTSLFVITLVAGLSLGLVNNLTIEPKAKAKLARKVNALKLVLPEFNNNPVQDLQKTTHAISKDSIEIYPALSDKEKVGAAVIGVTNKGFSGLIKIMVGFTPDGSIQNIVVLEQKETPGLGTKMKDDKFIKQFRGKHPEKFNMKVTKDGGEVDALTGATISSRAFCEAAQMAYEVFVETQNSSN